MKALTEEELDILFEEKSHDACLSIYLPTAKTGQETQQNPIRLKNALKDAKEKLLENGLSTQQVNEFLEPARKLIDDTIFWQHQRQGLAIFISPDMFKYYRLHIELESSILVDNKFNIKPLVPVTNGNSTFYLLALSQNDNRLLKCTQNEVEEVDLEGVSNSLEETLQYDDGEKQIQSHASDNGGKMIFHGQGADKEDHKEDIKRYLREIDKGLSKEMDGESPLVVMAVDYLFHMYQDINSYPHLLDKQIEGNPDNLNLDQLHKEGRKIVDTLYIEEMKEAADRYKDALGSEQVSSDLDEIVAAAHNGQIELLFLPPDKEKWGLFDKSKNEVFIHDEVREEDSELFNLAALCTIQNGGKVYTLPEEDELFSDKPMVALLRYQY